MRPVSINQAGGKAVLAWQEKRWANGYEWIYLFLLHLDICPYLHLWIRRDLRGFQSHAELIHEDLQHLLDILLPGVACPGNLRSENREASSLKVLDKTIWEGCDHDPGAVLPSNSGRGYW